MAVGGTGVFVAVGRGVNVGVGVGVGVFVGVGVSVGVGVGVNVGVGVGVSVGVGVGVALARFSNVAKGPDGSVVGVSVGGTDAGVAVGSPGFARRGSSSTSNTIPGFQGAKRGTSSGSAL